MTVSALAVRQIRRAQNPLAAWLRSPWLRLLGPAFAVSIGYIDPGNWATDVAAGTYGFRLLWVVFVASAIALVLQLAVSHTTIVSGEDLGTLIARRWPRWRFALWLAFQGAAVATDVAEFSGVVLGLQLLLRWSLLESIGSGLLTIAIVMFCTDRAHKALEYVLVGAVAVVSIACFYQVGVLHPAWLSVAAGVAIPRLPDSGALIMAVGIIGATVMPHNLFLHSSLVQRQCAGVQPAERRKRGRFFTKETIVALNVAAVVNAAILIIGGMLHGASGSFAHAFDSLALHGSATAVVFGSALLLSGLAASTTATVSGDVIFAAFSKLRVSSLVRRAVTLAPAAFILACGVNLTAVIVWSQVLLALVLPLVLVPLVLVMFDCAFRANIGTLAIAATTLMALVCVVFDAIMLVTLL